MTPIKAASAAKPPVRRQSAAEQASLARYGVRAVDTGNDTQKTRGEATYTAPALRSACSPSSCKLPMSGVEGNAPRPSLGVQKGVFSSRREYPLCLAAAQRAARTHAAPLALQPPTPTKGDQKGIPSSRRESPLCLAAAQRAALFMQRNALHPPIPRKGDPSPFAGEEQKPPSPGKGEQQKGASCEAPFFNQISRRSRRSY